MTLATVLAVLLVLALSGIGWAAVWLPRMSETWLPVSDPAAATLRALSARIRSSDEVVAQQGIATDLARRRSIKLIFQMPDRVSVSARQSGSCWAQRRGASRPIPPRSTLWCRGLPG